MCYQSHIDLVCLGNLKYKFIALDLVQPYRSRFCILGCDVSPVALTIIHNIWDNVLRSLLITIVLSKKCKMCLELCIFLAISRLSTSFSLRCLSIRTVTDLLAINLFLLLV